MAQAGGMKNFQPPETPEITVTSKVKPYKFNKTVGGPHCSEHSVKRVKRESLGSLGCPKSRRPSCVKQPSLCWSDTVFPL